MSKAREFAAYKGDEFLVVGTAAEVAQFMGWKNKKQTVSYSSRKGPESDTATVVFELENDDFT